MGWGGSFLVWHNSRADVSTNSQETACVVHLTDELPQSRVGASDKKMSSACNPSSGRGRANLSKLVDEAVRTHERIEVTRQGPRAVVILSADDYYSIIETPALLIDQGLMGEIRAAQSEAAAGQIYTLDEVTEEMRAAGRLLQRPIESS